MLLETGKLKALDEADFSFNVEELGLEDLALESLKALIKVSSHGDI